MVFGERQAWSSLSWIDSGPPPRSTAISVPGPVVGVLAARSSPIPPVAGGAASLPPTKGNFVNRLWSRAGVRVAAVGLLVAGAAGGIYLGQDREVQQQNAEARLVVQVRDDTQQLLKQRQDEHAADRAKRSQAENVAAQAAATEAKVAAGKAHQAEQKAVAKAKAEAEAKAKAKAKAEAEAKKKAEKTSKGPDAYTGDIPASCSEYSGSRGIGCAMMLDAGFKIDQFPCLDKLWKRESGWDYKARNDSSGAFGIPQALPGSKMASKGDDWETNPATQIAWGLDYIEGRYDTPCGAWNHSEDTGWY
jgi:hypothetical protein